MSETAERATGSRELGVDPVSGKKIYSRIGRFGPMIQIGEVEDEEKPRFASLRKDQSIQTITFQEALDRPVQSKPRLKKLLREPGVLG